jgi:hypothetical protein
LRRQDRLLGNAADCLAHPSGDRVDVEVLAVTDHVKGCHPLAGDA